MASPSSLVSLESKRWHGLRQILERTGPFCKNDFSPSPEILEFLQNTLKVLVVGAGGLGCELLKDLALMGFGDVHVIDMDTIELSNLNRQFLFRRSDIGAPKAEVAARFINMRIPTCRVTPHYAKIQDFDSTFYQQFHFIISGLDSIVARRWLNGMVISMITYNDDGSVEPNSIVPLIDGGSEGFKGSARVIIPGLTSCLECTLDLYPKQTTYPLCTIANTPRLPEHCIEYVKIIQWDKENPFNVPLDGDDPQHLAWIFERATERASEYNITGVTYRLTQGVIKNIIPAVASTNAIAAAACATEAFKLATSCFNNISNYLVFNNIDGIYALIYETDKCNDCITCGNVPQTVNVEDPNTTTLEDLIKTLCEDRRFQFKSPGLTTIINSKNKTLYMSNVKSIEERTRANLTLSLGELFLKDGQEVMIADQTTPNIVTVKLKYNVNEVEMA